MRGFTPKRPTGASGEALFDQWVFDTLLSLRPQLASGQRTMNTTRGFVAVGTGSARIYLPAYAYQSMEDDYLICRSWDGTTLGTTDILIAKPPELQFSIAEEQIPANDGTLEGWGYGGYDTTLQKRQATGPATQEDQYIAPRYLKLTTGSGFAGTIVYALPAQTLVKDNGGNSVNLIDLNVGGRAWTTDEGSVKPV